VRALVYIQYLLGIGHVMRGVRVARALARRGIETTIAFGGVPAPGLIPDDVPCLQLDPVRVLPQNMSRLVDASGVPFGDDRRAARRNALLAAFDQLSPDILVLESYPFGRRQMRFELLPLLGAAAARSDVLIASSIRDILQENPRPDRVEEIRRMCDAFFDCVLVHGDEAITPLSMTFPAAGRLAARTIYTGVVGPDPPATPIAEHDVVLSAGGGAVGAAMMATVVEAARDPRLAGLRMLLTLGPNLPTATADRVRARAPANVQVETFVPDLTARLAGARLSVSQAGYNTVADILVAGVRSVLLPFEGEEDATAETEQLTRARALERQGRAMVLTTAELDPQRLAAMMLAALDAPKPTAVPALAGAARAAEALVEALALKRAARRTR
jgi:predicted glycosyltransferase